jgi:hypothetical protein
MTESITVSRAIETLMRYLDRDGESSIVVARKTLSGSVGGLPTIPITGFSLGFDWNSGKVFAVPGVPIQAAGEAFEEERAAFRELSEKLGWVYFNLNSNIPDTEKLKNIRKIIERKLL